MYQLEAHLTFLAMPFAGAGQNSTSQFKVFSRRMDIPSFE